MDATIRRLKDRIEELSMSSRFLKKVEGARRDAEWSRAGEAVKSEIRATRIAIGFLQGKKFSEVDYYNGWEYNTKAPQLRHIEQVLRFEVSRDVLFSWIAGPLLADSTGTFHEPYLRERISKVVKGTWKILSSIPYYGAFNARAFSRLLNAQALTP